MTEAEWLTCEDIHLMVLNGPFSRREDLFGVACCRVIWHLLNEGSKHAIEWMEANAGSRLLFKETLVEDEQGIEHARNLNAAACGDDTSIQARAALVAHLLWLGELDKPFYWFGCGFGSGHFRTLPHDTPTYLAAVRRDIFGNPFRPVVFSPEWRTATAVSLAEQMYDSRDFGAMPILADALQDAGCDDEDVLNHCRGPGPHVRGCWMCDLVLGKE